MNQAVDNPIINLFKNHINKDLDQNFIDALEALLFLTNATEENFTLTFSHKLPQDIMDNVEENASLTALLKQINTVKQHIDDDNYWGSSYNSGSSVFGSKLQEFHNKQEQERQMASFKEQFGQVNKAKTNYVQYTPSDVLVFKLVENLRRLYSASKAQEREEQNKLNTHVPNKSLNGLFGNFKSPKYNAINNASVQTPLNNEKTLIEQQSFIYKAFELILPYTTLSKNAKWFEKAIFGQNMQVSPLELWAYLGMHEFVQKENRSHHHQVLSKTVENHQFSQNMLVQMSKLIPPFEQKELIYTILKHSNINDLCETTFNNSATKPTHSWTLSVCEYLFNPKNQISDNEFGFKQKSLALNTLLKFNLLDSPYYSQFISNNDDFFNNMKDQTSSPDFAHIYKKALYGLPFPIIDSNNNTVQFLFNNIRSLDNIDFFASTLKSSQLRQEYKYKIFNLYNLENNVFLKDVATKVDHSSGEMRDKYMKDFLSIGHNATNKDLITHIISLNSTYMPVCKAAYLQIRFSENLQDKTDNKEENLIAKRKI